MFILTGIVLLIRVNFDTGPVKNCRNSINISHKTWKFLFGDWYHVVHHRTLSLNMKVSKLLQSYYIPTLTCLKQFSCQGYRIFQDTAICGFRVCYSLPFFLEGYTQGKGWLMRSYKWESEKKSSIFQKKYFWKWCTASWFTCTNAFNGCT